ncbi:MAG: hypothetical protein Q8P61_01885 [Candidatus Nanopelagicales bacterium]|nr:hypothetical protein [Candidatus Nanopelagicales bacterium]
MRSTGVDGADALLVVDANAVLALAIAGESLKSSTWRYPQVGKSRGALELDQFASRCALKFGARSTHVLTIPDGQAFDRQPEQALSLGQVALNPRARPGRN